MELKSGLRLRSQVCSTEIIVVKPVTGVEITCGGHLVIAHAANPSEGLQLDPELSSGTQLGKRYTDDTGELEVLVTKPGEGTLANNDKPLPLKEAKALPSSD